MKSILILSSVVLLVSVTSGAPTGDGQEDICGEKTLGEKLKTSFGVYTEEITDHSLFEAYGAITYEIQIPDEANRKFFKYFKHLCDGFNCDRQDCTEWQKAACPLYSLYVDVEKHLKEFLFPSHQSFKFPGVEEQSLKLDCEGVTEPFGRSEMTPEEQRQYLRSLNACAEQRVLNADLVQDFLQDQRLETLIAADTKFTEIFNNTFAAVVIDEYTKMLPLALSAGYATAAAHEGIGFTEAFAEVIRWKDAAAECKQRKIPTSVISGKSFRSSLEEFQLKKLDIHKNETLLEFGENLSFYEENQLTDCVRVKDSLFVRILIPVKKTNEDWRLFGVKSVPFVKSPMEEAQVCWIKDLGSEKYFAIEMDTTRIIPLKKPRGRKILQRVSSEGLLDPSLQAFRSSCGYEVARKLARENETNLQGNEHCKVTCESARNFRMPWVTRISSDKFFVAGVVREDDKSREIHRNLKMFEQKHNGGIEITVGCDKHIDVRKEKFLARYPCNTLANNLEKKIIIGSELCNNRWI